MAWKVPQMWKDGECWILGGGPSMPQQFGIDNSIIQKVLRDQEPPSIYSPYLKVLHTKNVIGVNAAYKIGNWIKVIFFGDKGFYMSHKNELAQFPNIKITCAAAEDMYELQRRKIKLVKRDARREGISERRDTVCWNYNSGSAAINVAVHMGVKRIYLLGFDMKATNDNQTHWHNVYNNRGKKPRENTYNRHLRSFPRIAKDAEKMGIEIINVSHNSAIEQFPKYNLSDIL